MDDFYRIERLEEENKELLLENMVTLRKLHSLTLLVKEFLNSEMTKQEFLVKVNSLGSV